MIVDVYERNQMQHRSSRCDAIDQREGYSFFFFLIRLVYGCVQCRCSETRIFAKQYLRSTQTQTDEVKKGTELLNKKKKKWNVTKRVKR